MNLANAAPVLYSPANPEAELQLQGVIRDLVAIGIDDPTFGLYSPTQIEEGGLLDQLRTDTINGVVTGRESLDALENYPEEWRSRGGDRIREEYQEALATVG